MAKKNEKKMYVGPTLYKLDLVQNAVYEEIPTAALEAFQKNKFLKRLFVPVEKYPEANNSLRQRNGIYWDAFEKALKL